MEQIQRKEYRNFASLLSDAETVDLPYSGRYNNPTFNMPSFGFRDKPDYFSAQPRLSDIFSFMLVCFIIQFPVDN